MFPSLLGHIAFGKLSRWTWAYPHTRILVLALLNTKFSKMR